MQYVSKVLKVVAFSGLLETERCLKTMEELKMEKIANVTISIHPLVHIVDLGVTKMCTDGPLAYGLGNSQTIEYNKEVRAPMGEKGAALCIEGAPTIVWECSQGSFPEEVTFKLGLEG